MARRNPTFMKRQKEQKRLERANAKRVARQARRIARTNEKETGVVDSDEGLQETIDAEELAPDENGVDGVDENPDDPEARH
ncbi:MAG TPA: hypothetical protein VEY91_05760 [Candidatus Limnocylindria bacterium]|nr:hypothetical protein [Candidatus Limnocylindria bacterium]